MLKLCFFLFLASTNLLAEIHKKTLDGFDHILKEQTDIIQEMLKTKNPKQNTKLIANELTAIYTTKINRLIAKTRKSDASKIKEQELSKIESFETTRFTAKNLLNYLEIEIVKDTKELEIRERLTDKHIRLAESINFLIQTLSDLFPDN